MWYWAEVRHATHLRHFTGFQQWLQAPDGTQLMPTKRHVHVQKLLKRGKARDVEHVPFAIRLKCDGPKNVQPLFGGTDPWRTNISSAVMTADGTVIYKDLVKTIASLMAEYRQYRQESCRSECLRRKRLARRLGTTMKSMLERRLPSCGEGIVIAKDILNTERGSAIAGGVKIG